MDGGVSVGFDRTVAIVHVHCVVTNDGLRTQYLFTGGFLQYEQDILLSGDAFVDQAQQMCVLKGGGHALFVV